MTGCDDRTGPENARAFEAFCKKAGIMRVANVEKAIEQMQQHAAGRRKPGP